MMECGGREVQRKGWRGRGGDISVLMVSFILINAQQPVYNTPPARLEQPAHILSGLFRPAFSQQTRSFSDNSL